MRLSSIASLVVVIASFALGGCAADGEPAVGSDAPAANVVHSDPHAGVPDQRHIADVIAIGNGKLAPELGKAEAVKFPMEDLGVGNLTVVQHPQVVLVNPGDRPNIPVFEGEPMDPSMKLTPYEPNGSHKRPD